jgi:hypothetical protein
MHPDYDDAKLLRLQRLNEKSTKPMTSS